MRLEVEEYMRLAINLAGKAQGRTFPNPLVGAVAVKNGRVVGRGYHHRAGGPHAEIYCLKQASGQAAGAVLFCTFEPCAHYGRTGPCVEAIIRAGIKKVYVGMVDPNPLAQGKGIRHLRRRGIEVEAGFLEEEISRLNEPFIKAMRENRPLVTLKIAESVDGKIASVSGESKWITNEFSRRYSHRLRGFFDGIMVGVNTVLKDDPGLEPAASRPFHKLTKIVVDSALRIPLSARLLQTNQPVLIAAVKKNPAKESALFKKGAKVIYNRADRGRVDLGDLLRKLNALEIRNLLVEGGAQLAGSFLDRGLADKALIFIAPKIIGGSKALSAVAGEGIKSLDRAIRLEEVSLKNLRGDILVEGSLRYVD